MGWLIALAVLVGLGCIPVGAFARYDSQGLVVQVVAGWFHLTVIPKPGWMKKKKKPEKDAPAQPPQTSQPLQQPQPPQPRPTQPASPEPKEEKGGSLTDFLPLVRLTLDCLNQFRRKLRMDDLVLVVTLAGEDPCDLAVNYGRAWQAMGNLVPRLEKYFVIRKRRMEVQCDFTSQEIRMVAQVRLTITVARLLRLVVVYAYLFIKEYWKIQKKRKGGTQS